MRKIFISLVVVLALSAAAEAREKFVKFPALGVCSGTYVRYREDPDTESEILGRLNEPDRVIVLGQTSNNGQLWYEIENPKDDNTACLFLSDNNTCPQQKPPHPERRRSTQTLLLPQSNGYKPGQSWIPLFPKRETGTAPPSA